MTSAEANPHPPERRTQHGVPHRSATAPTASLLPNPRCWPLAPPIPRSRAGAKARAMAAARRPALAVGAILASHTLLLADRRVVVAAQSAAIKHALGFSHSPARRTARRCRPVPPPSMPVALAVALRTCFDPNQPGDAARPRQPGRGAWHGQAQRGQAALSRPNVCSGAAVSAFCHDRRASCCTQLGVDHARHKPN